MNDPDPLDPTPEPPPAADDLEDASLGSRSERGFGLDSQSVRFAREFLFTGRTARSTSPQDEVARRIAALHEAQERRAFDVAPPPPAADGGDLPPSEAPAAVAEITLSATGVRRAGTGWRASCRHPRGVEARYVSDARNGGYVGAFLQALEVRDRFYRERGLPIPPEATAVLDGRVLSTEIERTGDRFVVRWQGEEHEVDGDDAEEIATETALDLFVELVSTLPGAPAARR